MPNNINALPGSGAISLQDIADAFYLYKSYSDGLSATIHDYYGDLIKYYTPLTPKLPVTTNVKINIDPFHSKRFAFPVPLTASGNNYNVYDQANTYTVTNYGYKLNTPGIPFEITVENNGNIGSTAVKGPGLSPGSAPFTTPGTYTWTVPANVTTINVLAVGGGGGGGGGGFLTTNGSGGGGGGGGQVTTVNSISVNAGDSTTVVVGSGGSAGAYTDPGSNGGISSVTINATTYSANGGRGGLAWSPGTGGLAGGSGGSDGGTGSQATGGGKGGTTLVSSYGTGGSGGGGPKGKNWIAAGTAGTRGEVLITYATNSSTTKNTQNTAAMVIGTSSDGTKTFNSNTNAYLINNGTIVGATDTTGTRFLSDASSSPFTVNEGETVISYTIAGGGGGGGQGGHADHGGPGAGGPGGTGASATGSMPVAQSDVISYSIGGGGGGGEDGGASEICRNGTIYATAVGGGSGGSRGSAGTSYSGGGEGGKGGGSNDTGGSGRGGSGKPGKVTASYIPNLPGGPALYITRPTYITNNGTIAGGKSSSGVLNSGYSIIGKQYATFTITGKINGNQIDLNL